MFEHCRKFALTKLALTNLALMVTVILGLSLAVACGPEATVPPPEPTAKEEQSASASEPLVVHNGMLITATGEEQVNDGIVVIEGGRITAVGSRADIAMPEDATLVDANGGTILPGIIDVRASDLLNVLEVDEGQIGYIGLEVNLIRALRAGLTTVRATGWDMRADRDITEMRAALESHGNTIPTVVLVGPLLTHTGGTSYKIYPDQSIGVATVDEAREATEALIEQGLDQVGFLMALPSSGRLAASDEPLPSLTPAQQETIVGVAHAHDVRVIAQAIFPDEAASAVAAGVDEISSWPVTDERLPDDLIQALVDNSVPIMTGYTVTAVKPNKGDARRFIDAGGTIVFGTFAPNSNSLANFYHEMNLMALVGEMTPMEIILSATANAAEAVGLGDEIGTLEPGKVADIIVVDGNPLDDLTVFRDDVVVVIKGGELVPLDS